MNFNNCNRCGCNNNWNNSCNNSCGCNQNNWCNTCQNPFTTCCSCRVCRSALNVSTTDNLG